MKKLNVILSIMLAVALIAVSVSVAQEEAKEPARRGQGQQMRRMRGMMGAGHGRMMMHGRGPGRGRAMGMGRGASAMLRMADELELSEAQRSEIDELITARRKDNIKQKAELDIARVDLEKLIKQEDPDLDAIESQLRDIAMMQASMQFAQIKIRIDAKNVLSDEQQEAFKKLLKEKAAKAPAPARAGARMGRGPRRMGAKAEK